MLEVMQNDLLSLTFDTQGLQFSALAAASSKLRE